MITKKSRSNKTDNGDLDDTDDSKETDNDELDDSKETDNDELHDSKEMDNDKLDDKDELEDWNESYRTLYLNNTHIFFLYFIHPLLSAVPMKLSSF